MLEESKELFSKINKSAQEDLYKKAKRKRFFDRLKKYGTKTIVILILSLILFFPKQTGNAVGTWISDFFGPIIKESVKIVKESNK